MLSRYGLHLQLVQHAGSLRFALWFEHDRRSRWSQPIAKLNVFAHPYAVSGEGVDDALGLPPGAEPASIMIQLPLTTGREPERLPGFVAGRSGRRGTPRVEAAPMGAFIVSAWLLPPSWSLADLRGYLDRWLSTQGPQRIAPRALAIIPFLDELIGLARRGPLLPTLAPGAARPDAPIAWVPSLSLDAVVALAGALGEVDGRVVTPNPSNHVGLVPPWNLAVFLVELFAATSVAPPMDSSMERALRDALASPEGPSLHRAHGSCLYPAHPLFGALASLPRAHLHARLHPRDGADAQGESWVMRLGVLHESGAFLSLDELCALPDPHAPFVEHREAVFAHPFKVVERDWITLAGDGIELLCEPESLPGTRRVSEALAQRLLTESRPQDPDTLRVWQESLRLYSAKRLPRATLAFSAAPGSAVSARVRVRWELVDDPDGTARLGLHTARFAPSVELAVGGERLDAEEAARLLSTSIGPFVKLREHVLPRDDLSAALELLRAREIVLKKLAREGGVSFSKAVSLDDEWSAERGLQEESIFAARWERFLSDLRDGVGVPQRDAPPGFKGTLRPYQARGLSWLAFLAEQGFGACLADDMGLGKTVQVLALFASRRAPGAPRPRGADLVVCPTAVVSNWAREAKRFAPKLKVYVHQGGERARDAHFERAVAKADVVITSFAIVRRDEAALSAVRWGALVVDEAQNVKNPAAQQTRVLRALDAESKFALTGTPVENHLRDLWSIFDVTVPGLLGGPTRFARVFEAPMRSGDPAAMRRLKRRVGPFLLRRTKGDPEIAADLPPIQEQDVACRLTREQAALYEAMYEATFEGIADKDGISRRAHILASLTRMKQICDHPECFEAQRPEALFSRSGKLDRALELIEELIAEGQRVLVFTQFIEMGEILKRALSARFGVAAGFYHGGLTAPQRTAMIDEFQSERGPPALILSLRAGGAGLNLTAASAVIHYDRWWNPAVEDQASDRAHRIGQRRMVNVYRMFTEGTLEERIAEVLEKKRALSEQVLGGADDSWITEMDDRALRAFLSLDRDVQEDP